MYKSKNILIVLIFSGFLAVMTLGLLLLPKKEFSAVENRYLEKMPKWDTQDVLNGTYMTSFESYISDHVPFRDGWVQLHALIERMSGKDENGGVYFAKKDTLIKRVEEPDPTRIEKNISYINTFAEKCSVKVYFGLIPTAAQVWAERLPEYAPTTEESLWIQTCYENCIAQPVDIQGALAEHSDENIFYRTDHHWTTLGAFYGANVIFETMGMSPLSEKDYEPVVVSDNFCGTLWSASGAWWTMPDTIETWVLNEGIKVTSWFDMKPEEGNLYHGAYLEKKDQYSFFLGGNQPLCVIETQKSGDKLLVLRDSYTDALAPFLTEQFSEIHLLDLRYNKSNVLEYINENEIDVVLILYGFSGFSEDRNLVFLSR